jgi:hypothetical protein
MFATAVEDGLLHSNPISGIRIPAGTNDEPEDGRAKALTRAELRILLAAIPAERRLLCEFLAHTGMRISEVVGLTWANLDLGERPRVRVREQFDKGERKRLKSGSGRRDVPLSPGMAAKLIAHRSDHFGGEDAPVFARRGGRELYPQNVARHVLHPAARSVGVKLDGRPFHTFRHTCASLLFGAGRNVRQVADWLGHADPSFTLRTYVPPDGRRRWRRRVPRCGDGRGRESARRFRVSGRAEAQHAWCLAGSDRPTYRIDRELAALGRRLLNRLRRWGRRRCRPWGCCDWLIAALLLDLLTCSLKLGHLVIAALVLSPLTRSAKHR